MNIVSSKPTPYEPASWSLLFYRFPRQSWRRLLLLGASALVFAGSLRYGNGAIANQPPLVSFLVSALYIGTAFFLLKYLSQTLVEMQLCYSIIKLSRCIRPRASNEKNPSKTKAQSKLESVRRNLHDYVEASTATLPAINDFVFENLQKHIDVFFYVAGMVLFAEKPDYYSSSEEQQMEIERSWEEANWSEEKEMERIAEEAQRSHDELTITRFDMHQLRSFSDRLSGRMFRVGDVHPFLGFKYPVNAVDLMKFFEYWITTLTGCKNAEPELPQAKEDVERFYSKRSLIQEKKQERSWTLFQGLVIAIFSAFVVYLLDVFK